MLKAMDQLLISLAEEDESIVLIDSNPLSPSLACFAEHYRDRYFNVGMAEIDLIATAVGMASAGRNVWVCCSAARLLGRSFDALRTAIAAPELPVRILASRGGLAAGEDGAVAQILEDLALMRALPGFLVEVPSDSISAVTVARRLSSIERPAYIRLSGVPVEDIYNSKDVEDLLFGCSPLTEGDGVTICACGIMVQEALKAAKILSQQSIDAEVIDCHSVVPLSERTILASVHRTGCCVVAEEHGSRGGLGEGVSAMLCKNYPVPVRFVSVRDRSGQSGSPRDLLEYYGLTYQQIVGAAVEVWTMRRI